MITVENLKKSIENSMEETELPNRFLKFFRKHEGEEFSMRLNTLFKKEFPDLEITRDKYNHVYIQFNNNNLFYVTTTLPCKIDSIKIASRNIFIESADKRNEKRKQLLENETVLRNYLEAHEKMIQAAKAFSEINQDIEFHVLVSSDELKKLNGT